LVIGVVGTGNMGFAHATLWTQQGYRVILSSRDPAKAVEKAKEIGGKCEGASHVDMLRASNFIVLAIYAG
jgi:predicted dinucleotide-binding enzyme